MVQDQIERKVKRACLARSGIYLYTRDELGNLHLGNPPPELEGKRFFAVYRPAVILAAEANNFTGLPLTHHHAPERVNPDNFREFGIGWSGDTATVEPIDGTGEVGIFSTVTIADAEGFEALERGEKQLSPEYDGIFRWESGVTDKGEEYDIVWDGLEKRPGLEPVNHLALLPKGRGGKSASVLDHAGEVNMPIASGLWRAIRKRLAGVKDQQAVAFEDRLKKMVADRATLTPEAIGKEVDALKADCADLPDSPHKEKVLRFVSDLSMVKDKAPEMAEAAVKIIAEEYRVADAEATAEVPPEKKPEEKPAAGATSEPGAPAKAAEQPAAPATSQGAPAAGTAQDPKAAALNSIADSLAKFVDGVLKTLQPAAPAGASPTQPAGAAADDAPDCPDCSGKGKTADGKDCATCDGTGKKKSAADDKAARDAKATADAAAAEAAKKKAASDSAPLNAAMGDGGSKGKPDDPLMVDFRKNYKREA